MNLSFYGFFLKITGDGLVEDFWPDQGSKRTFGQLTTSGFQG